MIIEMISQCKNSRINNGSRTKDLYNAQERTSKRKIKKETTCSLFMKSFRLGFFMLKICIERQNRSIGRVLKIPQDV